VVAFIGFYFLLLRPVRSYTADILKSNIEIEHFETYSQSSVGLTILYSDEDLKKEFAFKMPFGMFFLLSTISLIFINANWRDFGILCAIQSVFWLIAFICMIIGSKGNLFFLEVMDMVLRYLLPLSSLGFPAYLLAQKKMETDTRNYEV
jgi:hypothetical protein